MNQIPSGFIETSPGQFYKSKTRNLPESSCEGVERERDLHDDVEAEIKRNRWLYVHSRMDRPTTTAKGVPDFLIFRPGGKALFAELKTRTGKLSPEQTAWKYCAEILGYEYVIIRSMADFMKAIANLHPGSKPKPKIQTANLQFERAEAEKTLDVSPRSVATASKIIDESP